MPVKRNECVVDVCAGVMLYATRHIATINRFEQCQQDTLQSHFNAYVNLIFVENNEHSCFSTLLFYFLFILNNACCLRNNRFILRDVRPHIPKGYIYTLHDIGLVINKLMGGAYR